MKLSDSETNFLKELAELTKKYGIEIGGCGCCGSPYLEDCNVSDERSGYALTSGGHSELTWVSPDKEFRWEHYSDKIIS